MNRLRSNKICASIVLGAIILQSLFFIQPSTAQAINFGTATTGVISAGIGCAASNLIQRKLSGKISSSIEGEVTSAAGVATQVSVVDSQNNSNTGALANKENCLKKIARAASQVVLREVTKETVAWINTGFNGQPLFVRNPSSFFKSIRDQEIGGFAQTVSDKNKYPFGQAFLRGYVNSIQNGFERNAQYSLNQSLGGYTSNQYNNNFNLGGWSAWRAQTLPQNNPIGFSLLASNELNRRLDGTTQSAAQDLRDELQQGMGFLSQKVCVDPAGYTPPSDTQATPDIVDLENGITPDTSIQGNQVLLPGGDQCKRYETTTPGGVISSRLTSALDIPKENLLLAPEDLDASLQAVFDALLNQLFKKGLASLSDNSLTGTGSSAVGVSSSGGYGNNTSAATTNTSPSNENDQWFNQNPDFDITDIKSFDRFCDHNNTCYTTLPICLAAGNTSCLEKGVIPDQQNYIKAVIDDPVIAAPILNPQSTYPNAQTLSTNQKGQNYWLNRIIPEIYQLDYCIPGPHPGWETDAQTKLMQEEGKLKDVNFLEGNALGQFYDTITLGISHAIANLFSSVFTGESADQRKRETVYALNIAEISGIAAERDDNIGTHEKVVTIIETLFSRLDQAINARFSPVNLPSVAGESVAFFNKLGGYQSVLDKNNQDIISLQGAIRRMTELEQQIISLNAQLAAGTMTQANYDNSVDFVKRSFASLTPNIVTADDVQAIHDQTQQIQSDIAYIHNTLLKGPNGCEAQIPLVPAFSRVRAWPYPQPHFYDYPQDSSGNGSIDLGSFKLSPALDNLINAPITTNTYYPFMEYAYFGMPPNASLSSYPDWSEVHITDLMNFDVNNVSPTVGIFEAKIGPLW